MDKNPEQQNQPQPDPKKKRTPPQRRDTRGQDARVMKIHRVLNANCKVKFVTKKELAKHCGVSDRQIVNDINHMRDDLLLPFVEDTSKGYAYEERVEFVPHLLISQELCYTMLLAIKSVGGYRTQAQKSALKRMYRRISAALSEEADLDLDEMDRCLSFGNIFKPKFPLKRIDFLWRAAVRRIETKLLYKTPNTRSIERIIQPLHVHKLRREWIVFCKDSERPGFIRLALSRMDNVRATGKTFERPPEFKVENELKGAVDVFTGPEMIDVIVRVEKHKAHLVDENDFDFEVARKELPNGDIDMHLRVSSFVDLLDIIRGDFRGAGIPLHPRSIVEEWVAEAKRDMEAGQAVLARTLGADHSFPGVVKP